MTVEINTKEEEVHYVDNQALLQDMIEVIGKSSAVFKSQQRDDPEISESEKKHIAEVLLFENPVAFITRFGRFINERHIELFASFKNENNAYDIDFQVTQLRTILSAASKKTLTRNRRFEALRRLEDEGKYFSDEEMEKREPLLYHQLVGQYLSEKERVERYKVANRDAVPTFSCFLLQQAEKDALQDLRKQQEEEEAAEADTSDEDEPSHPSSSAEESCAKWGADWEDEEREKKKNLMGKRKKKVKITADEKKLLLQEFKTCVFTKFLDGLDAQFDYNLVDLNPEYDCLQVRSQDEEEKYFDEETCDETLCTDTGIEDY